MADTTITVPPFIFKKPKISIGPTGSAVDIACAANNLTVEPDQDENNYETFCNTYTSYSAPTWTITVTVLQSFGTGGLWTSLQPLMGTVVDFSILPDASKAAAPDNPTMSGKAMLKWMSFLDGAPGEASEFDIELGVQGTPTWATTLEAGTESAPEGTTAPEGATTPEPQPA